MSWAPFSPSGIDANPERFIFWYHLQSTSMHKGHSGIAGGDFASGLEMGLGNPAANIAVASKAGMDGSTTNRGEGPFGGGGGAGGGS